MNETILSVSKSIEDDKNNKPIATSLRNGIEQIKPMFMKPYLANCLLVFTIQFFSRENLKLTSRGAVRRLL